MNDKLTENERIILKVISILCQMKLVQSNKFTPPNERLEADHRFGKVKVEFLYSMIEKKLQLFVIGEVNIVSYMPESYNFSSYFNEKVFEILNFYGYSSDKALQEKLPDKKDSNLNKKSLILESCYNRILIAQRL